MFPTATRGQRCFFLNSNVFFTMTQLPAAPGTPGGAGVKLYYLRGQLKIATRDFSKTAGRTPIFEARIVIYDQIWVYNSVFKTFSTECTFLTFSPSRALLAAMARRGGTTRPKATARLQQLCIRCHAVRQMRVPQ